MEPPISFDIALPSGCNTSHPPATAPTPSLTFGWTWQMLLAVRILHTWRLARNAWSRARRSTSSTEGLKATVTATVDGSYR
ncbi:hypothetical protein [Streptomyces luteogriseus]|uniref:hypothetical protein n=1 Tax=Streptomyces luteogriseus TaxID=68233 RepID=UPI003FA36E28